MRSLSSSCLALALLAALPACGDDGDGGADGPDDDGGAEPLDLPDGCQPLLGGVHCTLPYPSDFFLADDASTPTGKRVKPTGAASLVTSQDRAADVDSADVHDGSSAIPTIVAVLPDEVTDRGLARLAGPAEESVADDASTILLAPDGSRVPHYVDLDPRAAEPRRRAIIIHPLVALEHRARYVVGIRGVERPDGGPAAPAEGFRRLRDGAIEGEAALAPLASRFETDVFAPLAAAGWAREELQLAWDFTVGSREANTADMLRVRELTLAWLDGNLPVVSQVAVTDDPEQGRIVRGKITGPLFLVEDAPGAELARGPDGVVVQNGTAEFDFVAVVPPAVRDQAGPGRALAYGHGFFGTLAEVESGSARTIANRVGAVLFGINWLGMSTADLPVLIGTLAGDPAHTLRFADRVHQTVANWIVTSAAIAGPLLAEPALQRPGGEPFYVAEPLGFIGISQGAILGAVMAAMNPLVDRISLNVGGAGFTHMMFRARPFNSFLEVIRQILEDPLDQQLFAASLQPSFDRIDPGTYADYLVSSPLDPESPRPVLFQAGLGDVAVPNLGSFLFARLVGFPLLEPSPSPVFGLSIAEDPTTAGFSLYDFGIDLTVYDAFGPAEADNPVHGGLKVQDAALEQLLVLLRDGVVTHTCDGPCDPN